MLALEEPGLCGRCHEKDDGTQAPIVIDSLYSIVLRLSNASTEAHQSLDLASDKGMMTTDEEFLLKEVVQSLINVRAAIHAFNPDSLLTHASVGLEKAEAVKTGSLELIDEYYFRRWGLAISTIIITIMAIALYLKIRRIEK